MSWFMLQIKWELFHQNQKSVVFFLLFDNGVLRGICYSMEKFNYNSFFLNPFVSDFSDKCSSYYTIYQWVSELD